MARPPAKNSQLSNNPPPHAGETVETLPAILPRPVVLVVDPEARVRAVLGVRLGRHGFTVLGAGDGPEAVAVCRERRGKVDAVLLDPARCDAPGAGILETLQVLDPRIRFCLMDPSERSDGPADLAGRIVVRIPQSLADDDLVRGLWLLVAGVTPEPEPPPGSEDDGWTGNPADERRASGRRPCWLAPRCYPLTAPVPERWRAELRDISASGARLVLDRPLEAGTIVGLELPGAPGRPPYRFVVRAVRVAPLSEGRWTLGCVFARRLTDARLETLLRELPPTGGTAE